jgi:hypothetical protein
MTRDGAATSLLCPGGDSVHTHTVAWTAAQLMAAPNRLRFAPVPSFDLVVDEFRWMDRRASDGPTPLDRREPEGHT